MRGANQRNTASDGKTITIIKIKINLQVKFLLKLLTNLTLMDILSIEDILCEINFLNRLG